MEKGQGIVITSNLAVAVRSRLPKTKKEVVWVGPGSAWASQLRFSVGPLRPGRVAEGAALSDRGGGLESISTR